MQLTIETISFLGIDVDENGTFSANDQSATKLLNGLYSRLSDMGLSMKMMLWTKVYTIKVQPTDSCGREIWALLITHMCPFNVTIHMDFLNLVGAKPALPL